MAKRFSRFIKAAKVRNLLSQLDKTPSRTIESGRVGVQPQKIGAGSARSGISARSAISGERRPAGIAPSRPVSPVRLPRARPIVPGQLPTAERIISQPVKALGLVKAKRILPTAQPLEPAPGEKVFVVAKKQTNEVLKALSPEAYRAKFGVARDITQPVESLRGERIGGGKPIGRTGATAAGLTILLGPAPLNHSGRLRKTGKPSAHWAAFAYLIQFGDGPEFLGVEFFSGFRCYYPSTTRADYMAIIAAGSGSYWVHDHLMGKVYVKF